MIIAFLPKSRAFCVSPLKVIFPSGNPEDKIQALGQKLWILGSGFGGRDVVHNLLVLLV
jgi:hypothetical protein